MCLKSANGVLLSLRGEQQTAQGESGSMKLVGAEFTLKWAVCLCAWVIAITLLYISYQKFNLAMALVALAVCATIIGVLSNKLRAVATVIVSTFLFLAVADELIYCFDSTDSSRFHRTYANDYVTFLDDIGRAPNPGRHRSRNETRSGDLIYDVIYTIGDDHFRVTPREDRPVGTEDSKRINFFGCSFTFGEGVNDDETFPYYVQQQIEGSVARNFGFHGYGLQQALAILKSDRDTSGQINVLMTSPFHAERASCVSPFNLGAPRYVISADGRVELAGKCLGYGLSTINDSTIAGIFVNHLLMMLHESPLYQKASLAYFRLPYENDKQFELYVALIKEIAATSAQRGQKLVIAFLKAWTADFTGSYSNEKVLREIENMHLDVVDVTLAESAEAVPKRFYLHDVDWHPTPAAHEARALIVAGEIRKVLSNASVPSN
jgi:hypothetical protein